MKLATYRDGSRDGHLVVVSRDLTWAHHANGIATRLQQVLDDWNFLSPQLEEISQTLNHGKARHAFAFDPRLCMAPLPRAYQWVGGAAHAGPGPDGNESSPAGYWYASDGFAGPRDDILGPAACLTLDFGPTLAAVTGDLGLGTSPDGAIDGIRLLMLANDLGWRARPANGTAPAQPLPRDRPPAAFGPVAVTPDELAGAWRGGRVHLALESARNGQRAVSVDPGGPDTPGFGALIASLCRSRRIGAGSIFGVRVTGGTSGSASRPGGARPTGTQQLRVDDSDDVEGRSSGTETAMVTESAAGAFRSDPGLEAGDSICLDMKGSDGTSVFGAIEQRVVRRADDPDNNLAPDTNAAIHAAPT